MSRRQAFLIVLLLVPLAAAVTQPLRITVSQSNQSVDFVITATDIPGGAGTDVVDYFYTAVNEKELEIRNPNGDWNVYVSRSDTVWDSDLEIAVLRTGDGNGSGTLSGGDADYVVIGTSDVLFFSGTGGDARNVPIQFRLRGQLGYYGIPIDDYDTLITYTVIDSP
jgi:hypothetical protein